MAYTVYIMASGPNGTLYVGVTSDLPRRAYEHRESMLPGFTRDNGCKFLVWYESFDDVNDAITFEKRVKRWRWAWKLELVERFNPVWDDLYPYLLL